MMKSRKPGRRLTEEQVQKKSFFFDFLDRLFARPSLLVIGFVFYCLNSALIVFDPPQVIRLGVPTRDDLIARIDFSYEDKEETNKKRTLEEALVPPLFSKISESTGFKRDVTILLEALTQYDDLKDVKPEWVEPWKIEDQPLDAPSFKHLSRGLQYLREQDGSQALILEKFTHLVREIEDLLIINEETNDEIQSLEKQVKVRVSEKGSLEKYSITDLYVITKNGEHPRNILNRVKELVTEHLALIFNQGDTHSYSLIAQLFVERLSPTLQLDREAVHKLRQEAREQVDPVMRIVKANEVILRRGQIPQAQHVEMLEAERQSFENRTLQEKAAHRLRRSLGRLFIYSIICVIFMVLITEGRSTITRNKGRFFSFCLLTTLVVASARFLVANGHSPLWIPLLFVAEIFQVVYGRRSARLSTVFVGCLLGFGIETSGVAVTMTLGALTSIYLSKDLSSRLTLIVSGFVGGLVMALMDLAFNLQGGILFDNTKRVSEFLPESGMGLANGFFTGIFLTGFLPVIEKLFRITTNITWLELANMNRPLLKRMALEAPGTWQHSQILATLSEAATERIGGNSLMARVVCYYHDIGKCIKPHYFVENQGGGQNPHEKLTPAMSALIIHSHPKDGVELAKEYGLPREVIDAILQHHGTTRVEYFYRIAVEKAGDPEDVREEMFRYPGPIPQYREMGVIMLADSSEGAVRALFQDSRDINPSRIRNQVEKIVREKIDMGQLDDSKLTLTEIRQVIDEFTRVLQSVYHNRIKYPKAPGEEEEDISDEVEATPS